MRVCGFTWVLSINISFVYLNTSASLWTGKLRVQRNISIKYLKVLEIVLHKIELPPSLFAFKMSVLVNLVI